MDMGKKKWKQQIKNYLIFVAAGVIILIIIALLSGCGCKMPDCDAGSRQKKVLSFAEIKELQELAMLDAEDKVLQTFSVQDLSLFSKGDDEKVEGVTDRDVICSTAYYSYNPATGDC